MDAKGVWAESLSRCMAGALAFAVGLTLSVAPVAASPDDLASVEAAWRFIRRNYYDQTFNGQDWEAAKVRYLDRAKKGEAATRLTREMVDSLGDRYSRAIDARTFEQLMAYDSLGVGLVLTRSENKDVFVSSPPFRGSASEQAGIQSGDVVTAIDGASMREQSLFSVVDKVAQGDSPTVVLSLRRGPADQPTKVWDAKLQRTKTKAPQSQVDSGVVNARSGKHKTGYLRLRDFDARTAAGVKQALASITSDKADQLLLDLRGNPGGSFQAAVEIAELFLPPGTTITQVATPASGGKEVPIGSDVHGKEPTDTRPLAVLVDDASASASEVLAVALRGNCRAPLVGTKSFGKAKVQGVFGLPNGEALALSVAQYSGPGGLSIGQGLKPDVPLGGGPFAGTFSTAAALLGVPTSLSIPEYETIDVAMISESVLKTCSRPS